MFGKKSTSSIASKESAGFLERLVAWQKAKSEPGIDPSVARVDDFGNPIRWSSYGDRSCPFGWEVDRITPGALGGAYNAENIRALNCKANASLGGLLGQLIR